MAPQEREPDPSLRERLFEEFYRFSFFRAVTLLERFAPDKKPLGRALEPEEEAVHFAVKPSFLFPPSDISHLEQPDPTRPVRMEVRFMGLIGPSGVLPHWYNELAIERSRAKDFALIDFFDIFHHRLIALFYLAWKRYCFPVNYLPGARDRLSWYLLCLIGLGTPGLRGRIGLPEESLIFCSGLLSRQVPSIAAVEASVEYLSGTSVSVDQFIERLIPISLEDQTSLGMANARLGMDTICGTHARECQTKFRVNLGPMGHRQFLRFLPTGDMLRSIFSLVRYMVGIEYEFEIRVILKRNEVPFCSLGMTTPAPMLGWSTWLTTPGVTLDYDPSVTFQEA